MAHTLAISHGGHALVYQQSTKDWKEIKSFQQDAPLKRDTVFGIQVSSPVVNWDITVEELLSLFSTLNSAVLKLGDILWAEPEYKALMGVLPPSHLAQWDHPRPHLFGMMQNGSLSPLKYTREKQEYTWSWAKRAWCYPVPEQHLAENSFRWQGGLNNPDMKISWSGEDFVAAIADWIDCFVKVTGTNLECICAHKVLM